MISKRAYVACILLAVPVAAIGTALLLFSFLNDTTRHDAPLGRMYATEQTMRHLATAMKVYRAHYAAYPPSENGIRLAMVLHCGPDKKCPGDGWGQPFVYVPAYEYDQPGSRALKKDGQYFAPDTYQLYSVGADGIAGEDDVDAQTDNIVSWAPAPTWRPHYRALHEQYLAQGETSTE